MAAKFTWTESDLNIRRSNFCKDHHGRIEVPDPLVVEDLVSYSWKIDEKHPDVPSEIFSNISLYCVISFANFRQILIGHFQ